jgi:hypothetical protein
MSEEPTNLQRAMWAENSLCEFDVHVRTGGGEGWRAVDDLYDPPADVAKDLVTNLCHFLHMDERAGCMDHDAIKALLDSAFDMFEAEQEECE